MPTVLPPLSTQPVGSPVSGTLFPVGAPVIVGPALPTGADPPVPVGVVVGLPPVPGVPVGVVVVVDAPMPIESGAVPDESEHAGRLRTRRLRVARCIVWTFIDRPRVRLCC